MNQESWEETFLHELISDDGGVLKVLSAQILNYQELDLKWSSSDLEATYQQLLQFNT